MTTELHDACVIAANQMVEDGIYHHVSYMPVPGNMFVNPTGNKMVIKVTIELVEDIETHWPEIEQEEAP